MKRSFILHLDSLEILHDLSSDEAGELLKAMYYYHLGDEYDLPSHLRLLLFSLKINLNETKTNTMRLVKGIEKTVKKEENQRNRNKAKKPKKPTRLF